MAVLDLSAFSTTQLQTFLTEATTALGSGVLSKRYKIGTRELERPDFKALTEWVSAVSCELTARGPDAEQVAVVEFDEQT